MKYILTYFSRLSLLYDQLKVCVLHKITLGKKYYLKECFQGVFLRRNILHGWVVYLTGMVHY